MFVVYLHNWRSITSRYNIFNLRYGSSDKDKKESWRCEKNDTKASQNDLHPLML